MSMQIENMSIQMLSQSHYKRIAEIIKEHNLTHLIGSNLTKELNRIISSGKVDLMKDQEFFVNLFGYQWDKDEYISSGMRVFFYWIYLIIFCIGISGNLLVIWVFITNKAMHSVTNLFIANLAISDILLCLFAVPFTPLYLLTFKEWVFGSALCHLVPYVQGVSVYISALTLMSIAIDRFFVIIYPFKPRMKMHICMLIILAIWISSAGLTLPYGYFVEIIESSHMNGVYYCDEIWPSESARRTFGISTSLLQFIIPVTIISYCYIRVCGKLSKTRGIIPGSSKSARKEELERERTSRTNRMLISMVIVFGVSWFPLNCYNLLLDFHIQAARWNYSRAFFLLSHSIAMSSTCYNPLLYAWLNENFRKEFKSVLPCWRSNQLNNLLTINNNNSSRRENHSSFRIIGNLLGNTVTTQTGDNKLISQNNHHTNCISLQKLGKNDRQNHEKSSFDVVPIEIGIDIENDESLNYNVNENENENGKSSNRKENGNGIRKHECNSINNNHKQQTTVKYLSNSNCIVMHTSHLNSLENGQDDHEEDLDDDDVKQIIL